MIKLVIFDIGGVLIDFSEKYYYEYLSSKTGISIERLAQDIDPIINRMELGKMSLDIFENTLLKKFGIRRNKIAWNLIFHKKAKLKKDVYELAKRISRRYTVVLLSNISISRYLAARKILRDDGVFRRRFASCYLGVRKPDRKIYNYVIRKMNVKPSEAVFIDNMEENTEGAEAVGINGIRFRNCAQTTKKLERLGVKV